MSTFAFLDKIELFVRTGKFPEDATQSSRKVTRHAARNFFYKDGILWRTYRDRLLRAVRSDQEVRELLTRYHDDNNHAGKVRTKTEIMGMYYWVGVTDAVRSWVNACAVCKERGLTEPAQPQVQYCLAYGCDTSSYVEPELGFHRFPKDAERRRRWLAVAQRDEASLRTRSCLCSRHFEPECFSLSEEGTLTLSPDAVPTIIPEPCVPSEEDFLHSKTLEDLLSTAAASATQTSAPSGLEQQCDTTRAGLNHTNQANEHQYCLPASTTDTIEGQTVMESKRRKVVIEPSFTVYNHIARYLSHKVLPMQSKGRRGSLKRMSKRFDLIDGQLMYTRVSPPVRVPRSREEVTSILRRFHDERAHLGQGLCQKALLKHYYWSGVTRDLSHYISSCPTCLTRTKRKWLRCSVQTCTNCCGPVERGLGITFHTFPLSSPLLMSQWMKAVGRPHWHPRLRSSVCSTHFTEESFDRSAGKVTVRPDAVPTLLVHNDTATLSKGPTVPNVGEEAYFAKYDAVELYLRKRTYPPGLHYVEKNTFRRFCKKFSIKDDALHIQQGSRLCLVLRSRETVSASLTDYHNELNHLDVNKCLRLLNERFFWKTMRSDVIQWIESCDHCSTRKRKKPANQSESRGQKGEGPIQSTQIQQGMDSGDDGDDFSEEDEDEAGGEKQTETSSKDREKETPVSSKPPPASTPPTAQAQTRIPILLHLKTSVNQDPTTPNPLYVTRLWSVKAAEKSTQSEAQKKNNNNNNNKTTTNISIAPPNVQTQVQSLVNRGSARTHRYLAQRIAPNVFVTTQSPRQPEPGPKITQVTGKQIHPTSLSVGRKTPVQVFTSTISRGVVGRPKKRSGDTEGSSPAAKKSSSAGLDPVVAPSCKPWPVFTIPGSATGQTAAHATEAASPAPSRRPKRLQARAVIQQVSSARVKTKSALDGADAQWTEIQEGMVVYVCFSRGAGDNLIPEMASRILTTKLFRRDTGHLVSILDLPGSVLLIPQDSLMGDGVLNKRVQYKRACEPWLGAQLFNDLVSHCRDLISGSAKCSKGGGTLEHGAYGQKQEIVVSSTEPMTLLMEF